jgi:acyl carrier protein
MVPASFVALEEFPLTPHGKIDRDALPPPPRETPGAAAGRPPESALEERVAAIAAELLRLDRIGVDENFFALGGHSLLGTQLIARVRDAFGIDLPLRTVFEAPTAARLSAEIENLVRRRIERMTEAEAAKIAGERA